MSAVVYVGRHRLELKIYRSKNTLRVHDTLGFASSELTLVNLFSELTLDQLHQAMKPVFEQAQVRKERDVRQLRDAQRKRIKQRDDHTCRYCGQKGDSRWGPDRRSWHIDHVEAFSKGGSDEDDNLVLACQTCNLAKSARDLEEFEADAQTRSLRLLGGGQA